MSTVCTLEARENRSKTFRSGCVEGIVIKNPASASEHKSQIGLRAAVSISGPLLADYLRTKSLELPSGTKLVQAKLCEEVIVRNAASSTNNYPELAIRHMVVNKPIEL
jgi:hypothetical protein